RAEAKLLVVCVSKRNVTNLELADEVTDESENKEKYQLGDYKLIQYQILQTNITRTVWQTVRRITNVILGVKGF
ncbi:hypothetical protein pdam_00023830, partial [Pocillopora damicornis]